MAHLWLQLSLGTVSKGSFIALNSTHNRTEQHETIRVRDLGDMEDVEDVKETQGRENIDTLPRDGDD
jgi:hypothetical protein